MQRSRERADRAGDGGGDVRAGRRDDARREGRRVHAVVGGQDQVALGRHHLRRGGPPALQHPQVVLDVTQRGVGRDRRHASPDPPQRGDQRRDDAGEVDRFVLDDRGVALVPGASPNAAPVAASAASRFDIILPPARRSHATPRYRAASRAAPRRGARTRRRRRRRELSLVQQMRHVVEGAPSRELDGVVSDVDQAAARGVDVGQAGLRDGDVLEPAAAAAPTGPPAGRSRHAPTAGATPCRPGSRPAHTGRCRTSRSSMRSSAAVTSSVGDTVSGAGVIQAATVVVTGSRHPPRRAPRRARSGCRRRSARPRRPPSRRCNGSSPQPPARARRRARRSPDRDS